MRLLVSLAAIFAAVSVQADPTANFDQAKWQNLIQQTAAHGDLLQIADGSGAVIKFLSQVVPNDRTVSHKADYFDVLMMQDPSTGKLAPAGTALVSEDWQIGADGNYTIEQWTFQADLSGHVLQAVHDQIVETKDGRVLGTKDYTDGDASNPAAAGTWASKVAEWIQITQP